MKQYNCSVHKIKERKVKDKYRYDVVGYKIYPNVTKDLALYLAVKYGGGLMGLDENNAPYHPNLADKVVGFNKWGNDIDFVAIHPVCYIDGNIDGISIIPMPECYTLPERDKWFNKRIENLIQLYQSDAFDDFSIEAYNIWGPIGLIPEGYKHVKDGLIQEGDFGFNYRPYKENLDSWLSVSASWSGCKIGDKIEYRGILAYKGDHGYHKDGEVTYGYDPFIIRKSLTHK